MKISKKLAREILTGNFENLPLDELQKDSRARTNQFDYIWEVKEAYDKAKPPLLKKDLEKVQTISIVYLPNESYARRAKGTLMTDVLVLSNWNGKFTLTVQREASAYYKKHVNLHVTPELKQEIIKRELDQLGYSI